MYAVFTAFALNENDITKGGTPIAVDCVRKGKMLPAKRDIYKRVYRENGTYHYPKTAQNQLWKKGHLYFEPLNLTGCTEGTEEDPKVSLLQLYKDCIIPAIEQKIVDKYSENGTVKVIIVKQEDSAGAHNNNRYKHKMQNIFNEKQWIIFNQPPQSPITNVHDACIFLMLSKKVSAEQAVTFGSTLLKGEQLHQTVLKVWNNKSNMQAIARAFAGHHQIVKTICRHKGDNKFLSQRGGLSFGVCCTFIRDEDGTGVIPITMAPQMDIETRTGHLLNDHQVTGLKYPKPNINEFANAELTNEMEHMLLQLMDPALMSDELHEVWYRITEKNPTTHHT